jgi:hypothetical protein
MLSRLLIGLETKIVKTTTGLYLLGHQMLLKILFGQGNLVNILLKLVSSVIPDPHRIQLTSSVGPTEVLSLVILFSSYFK